MFPEQDQGWNQPGALSNLYRFGPDQTAMWHIWKGQCGLQRPLHFFFYFFAEVLGICWEKVNSIQQLTDWMILVGQPSTRPQDEQHKVSDPEVLKSSWRMRRASPPQLSSPQADHAQGLTEPLLGAHLWLGEEMWPGPSPAGQHWIWQGKKDG